MNAGAALRRRLLRARHARRAGRRRPVRGSPHRPVPRARWSWSRSCRSPGFWPTWTRTPSRRPLSRSRRHDARPDDATSWPSKRAEQGQQPTAHSRRPRPSPSSPRSPIEHRPVRRPGGDSGSGRDRAPITRPEDTPRSAPRSTATGPTDGSPGAQQPDPPAATCTHRDRRTQRRHHERVDRSKAVGHPAERDARSTSTAGDLHAAGDRRVRTLGRRCRSWVVCGRGLTAPRSIRRSCHSPRVTSISGQNISRIAGPSPAPTCMPQTLVSVT